MLRMIAAGAFASLLLVTGCGGDDDEATSTSATPTPTATAVQDSASPDASDQAPSNSGPSATVAVAADPQGGLSYEPSELTAKAGTVTIEFTNESQVPHDVVVKKGDEDIGGTEEITGSKTTTKLKLKPGSYTFYCSVPGHLQAGMEGTLEVQ